MDPEVSEKPFRKLRKALKRLPRSPSPEEVHDLRTLTRRAEVAVRAFRQDEHEDGKRLLKVIAPVRKKAGHVRDADVFFGIALKLQDDGQIWSHQQLIGHLTNDRQKEAKALHAEVERCRHRTDRLLKRCAARVVESIGAQGSGPLDVSAFASALAMELRDWPDLQAGNLHEYRLKVKELRNVLKLTERSDDGLLALLGRVKDEIGEWHDHLVLGTYAADVLENETCAIVKQLRATGREKLGHALREARELRAKLQQDGRSRLA